MSANQAAPCRRLASRSQIDSADHEGRIACPELVMAGRADLVWLLGKVELTSRRVSAYQHSSQRLRRTLVLRRITELEYVYKRIVTMPIVRLKGTEKNNRPIGTANPRSLVSGNEDRSTTWRATLPCCRSLVGSTPVRLQPFGLRVEDRVIVRKGGGGWRTRRLSRWSPCSGARSRLRRPSMQE